MQEERLTGLLDEGFESFPQKVNIGIDNGNLVRLYKGFIQNRLIANNTGRGRIGSLVVHGPCLPALGLDFKAQCG